MNTAMIQEIRERFEQIPTSTLKKRYIKHNRRLYSKEYFAAIREILIDREEFSDDMPIYDDRPTSTEASPQREYTPAEASPQREYTPAEASPQREYTSTYNTARAISVIISVTGWIVVISSSVFLLLGLLLPALASVFSGLLLVANGQIGWAAIDGAEFSRQILTIMKANQP